MTDAPPEPPAVTRRTVLRLGGAAIPAAALAGRPSALQAAMGHTWPWRMPVSAQ